MDPNAALNELEKLACLAVSGKPDEADIVRMGELFLALDGWMTQGGFPPRTWTRSHVPPPLPAWPKES